MNASRLARVIFLVALASWAAMGQVSDQAGPPKVQRMTPAVLDSLLTHREGRPLLLNVWATWCVPCVEEFPGLVALSDRLRGTSDVVNVSIDYEDEVPDKVKPFLSRMHATMPSFINVFPTQEGFINRLSEKWSGAVPATFVYDRSGRLVKTAIGKQTIGEFERLLNSAGVGK